MAEFNLEGLLGNAFGGGGGNFLDEYLTPEQRAAMQRNAMLAASAALLKAGGESTRRIGIGEALGGAFEAGQAGYEKAQTGALTQMALKQKLDEAKRAKELQKLIAGVFAPQAAAPGAAQNAAMPVNPNVARANQYRQAAQMLAMSGQGEQAMKYEELAQKLDPRDEVQGAPFEGTDAQGDPIMLQQMKGGTIRPISGYGVKQGAIGQPLEVTGPNGKPMLVQQLPNGTLREVVGVSAKQAAPSQPIEMTDAQGKSVMVQQMADGSLRPVSGFGAKQAAPSQPIEMTDAQGKSVMVQQMADGSLRPVSGFGAKQEAASAPIEVTGPDGKPMLVTPQRGGGYTPVVGITPKQNPSEKSKQLAELNLPPTLENFQLLESSTNEIKLLNKMGMPVTMANVTALRRASAGPAADRAPTLTTIVDPTNPNQMLSIDARRYSGGGVGSPGVLGVSGKEPGAALRQNKVETGKTQLADDLSNLRASFIALDAMKAIPSTQRNMLSNITSGISASGIGQKTGQLLGTEAQVERDVINSARSRLVNSIKNATGMSAQQLNSNVELQTMLKSISDPGHSIQSALRIIDDIEKAYVTGSSMAPPPPPAAQGSRLTPAQQAELEKLRLRFGGQN